MGRQTKIDWCDASWNPVTGCYHDCSYCYARGIANRFGGYWDEKALRNRGSNGTIHILDKPVMRHTTGKNRDKGVHDVIAPYPYGFDPTLHRYKLDEPSKWKSPKSIFVCSMADLFGDWVPIEWIQAVFDACKRVPRHNYIFLTKNPGRYVSLMQLGILPTESNFWYGSTATTPDTTFFFCKGVNTFISIEPIHAPFSDLGNKDCFVDWVIVGAETGRRKGKIIPKKEWIDELAANCDRCNTPIFMKESLKDIIGADFKQEFPWSR